MSQLQNNLRQVKLKLNKRNESLQQMISFDVSPRSITII